jgi:hypothetical protein
MRASGTATWRLLVRRASLRAQRAASAATKGCEARHPYLWPQPPLTPARHATPAPPASDLALNAVFTAEMLLRIAAAGGVVEYLREPWNVFDSVMVRPRMGNLDAHRHGAALLRRARRWVALGAGALV